MEREQPLLSYPTVCQYVGQLFLETRHELEQLGLQVRDLQQRVVAAEKSRDEALSLLARARAAKQESAGNG